MAGSGDTVFVSAAAALGVIGYAFAQPGGVTYEPSTRTLTAEATVARVTGPDGPVRPIGGTPLFEGWYEQGTSSVIQWELPEPGTEYSLYAIPTDPDATAALEWSLTTTPLSRIGRLTAAVVAIRDARAEIDALDAAEPITAAEMFAALRGAQ